MIDKSKMDILIDFDGTCVTHDFPKVGKDIGAITVLKKLTDNGHRLILFTMREDNLGNYTPNSNDAEIQDVEGNFLSDAVDWFKANGIPLYGIQTNPTQHEWTKSPKAYGHLIIDDTALNCPLKVDYSLSMRPFVDWDVVEQLLYVRGLI